MDQFKGKTAVVTGGGAGIGRALCHAFATEEMNVVVADIDAARAHEVAAEVVASGGRALPQACDVSSMNALELVRASALREFGRVDVLCNNAGVVHSGPLADAPQSDWDWIFNVNVWGVVNGIRVFAPSMKEQGSGHIVNTASLSGLFALRGAGIYTASKYAVVGISETLRLDLKGSGVGVSVVCPGMVHTRIEETARVRGEVEWDPEGPPKLGWRDPEDVARAVIEGIKANRLYVFSHPDGVTGTKLRFDSILSDFNASI